MARAIIIISLVVAVLVGGLFALRRSVGTGMPDAEVLRRAQERERQAHDQEDN
jgi:hypothetical protein